MQQRPHFNNLYKRVLVDGERPEAKKKLLADEDPNLLIIRDDYKAKEGTALGMVSPSVAKIFIADNPKLIDQRV